MIFSTSFDNCKEIGCFVQLTNAYCLIGNGTSYNTYSLFDQELSKYMPVVQCNVSDTGLMGRLTVGNKNGLLVPSTMNDHELLTLRNSLPDKIKIRKVDDRLSALGNCIACNDHVALIHPEFERESEEIISDILGVETFRTSIAQNPLVGSHCVFNNKGGLFHPLTTMAEFEELTSLLQIPICSGTVNGGSEIIAGGLVANDFMAFCGIRVPKSRHDYYLIRDKHYQGNFTIEDITFSESARSELIKVEPGSVSTPQDSNGHTPPLTDTLLPFFGLNRPLPDKSFFFFPPPSGSFLTNSVKSLPSNSSFGTSSKNSQSILCLLP